MKIKEATVRATSPPDVFDSCSLQRVHLQHEHKQRGNGTGQVLGDVEDASSDLLKQRGDMLVIKGQSAAQQGIQDYPAAPDVHLWACIEPDKGIKRRFYITCCNLNVNSCVKHTVIVIVHVQM